MDLKFVFNGMDRANVVRLLFLEEACVCLLHFHLAILLQTDLVGTNEDKSIVQFQSVLVVVNE